MKKLLLILLSIAIAFCFSACGSTNRGSVPSGGEGGGGGGGGGGEGGTAFTVTLEFDGQKVIPEAGVTARWSGEGDTVEQAFGSDGVAKTTSLDGNYKVTLSAPPAGYTYDPNSYFADNNNPNTVIQLLRLNNTFVASDIIDNNDAMYGHSVVVSELGTYRLTLTEARSLQYFNYEPHSAGIYTIESWVDVSANVINPLMDVYSGSFAFKSFRFTQDDGGSASVYTKNFKTQMQISRDEIGNILAFKLYVTVRSAAQFPVNIDFTIKYVGDYERDDGTYEEIYANGPFLQDPSSAPSGSVCYIYLDSGRLCDSSLVKLNWVDVDADGKFTPDVDEGDGFYHLYDEATYSDTDGYGPLLYAMLYQDNQVIETEGSNMGFWYNNEHIINPEAPPPQQVTGKLSLSFVPNEYPEKDGIKYSGPSYYTFINEQEGGYLNRCDIHGGHPVNVEIQQFLQYYATCNSLFSDGDGWAETTAGLNSSEKDMWLFSCYYYA